MNAYDIETYINDNNEHVPYCICYIINNIKKHFYFVKDENLVLSSIESIFTEKLCNNTLIYIHNLDFDGLLILSALSKNNKYKFKAFIKDLKIYDITIFFFNKKIHFRCSYKILPTSLKNISESFNLPSKMPFPYKFASNQNLNYIGKVPLINFFNCNNDFKKMQNIIIFNFKEYSIEYCYRDVEITSKFMTIIKLLLIKLKISLLSIFSGPSLALKIFSNSFNKFNISLRHNYLLDKFVRNAYYGGRCEIYGNPKPSNFIFHFDFSGMYAQCMKEKFVFGKYSITTNNISLDEPGFYWIDFKSNIDIPVLPHHRLNDKKLFFTNGMQSGCYWFEEIKLFLENGGIIDKIWYGVKYENYDNIFLQYIEYFDEIKKLGNSYKLFAKFNVNTLYGRLGMGPINEYSFFIKKNDLSFYEKHLTINSHIILNDIILLKVEINNKLSKLLKIAPIKIKNNISIAAAITAKARIKLFKAQQSVIAHGGKLLYSDTDSIFAEYPTNVIGEQHGEVFWDPSKNETIIKDAVFVNPKTYGILYPDNTQNVKMKGLNDNAITFLELKEKFYLNGNFETHNFLYLSKKELLLKNTIIKKKFDLQNYDKRKFIHHKTDTIPYTYENFNYI